MTSNEVGVNVCTMVLNQDVIFNDLGRIKEGKEKNNTSICVKGINLIVYL